MSDTVWQELTANANRYADQAFRAGYYAAIEHVLNGAFSTEDGIESLRAACSEAWGEWRTQVPRVEPPE